MITLTQVRSTQMWLGRFRQLWHDQVPLKIHSRDVDGSGAPDWSPQFRAWITAEEVRLRRDTPPTDKVRLRKAMKRLRERSKREYEVLYRVMVLGQTVTEVTAWLNERAERGGHPERYTPALVTVIVFAAVDKLGAWY